eukprot:4758992-Pyramimonas_sp.AAC.1
MESLRRIGVQRCRRRFVCAASLIMVTYGTSLFYSSICPSRSPTNPKSYEQGGLIVDGRKSLDRCDSPGYSLLQMTFESLSKTKNIHPELIDTALFTSMHAHVVGVVYGANHGNSSDDLLWHFRHFPNVYGILLEPVPKTFAGLTNNYGGIDGFTLVNQAICPLSAFEAPPTSQDNGGRVRSIGASKHTASVYTLDTSKLNASSFIRLPSWAKADGVSSFLEKTLKNAVQTLHRRGFRQVGYAIQHVSCTTVNNVIEENLPPLVTNIDYVQIDVEGMDWTVMSQLDLLKWKPLVIRWEHKHLSKHEQRDADAHVSRFGYEIVKTPTDTVAYRWWPCPEEQ